MKDELLKQKKAVEQEKLKLDKLFSKIAALRLVAFLAAVILILAGINKNTYFLVAGIVFVVIFIGLVKKHADIDDKLLTIKTKTNVINRYIKRCSGQWKNFEDNGSEFLKKEDTLSYDLDLLGRSSLYQLISVAHTFEGRRRLANTLSLKNVDIAEVANRHDAIMELASNKDFLVNFESTSERIVERRKKEEEKIVELSTDNDQNVGPKTDSEKKKEANGEPKSKSFPAIFYFLMILVPALNVFTVLNGIFGHMGAGVILASFIFGLAITLGANTFLMRYTLPLFKYGTSAKDYYKMLNLISEVEFKSKILNDIKTKVTDKDGLLQAINSLGTIGILYNFSFNPIIHMVLNGFLGWDFYIALATYLWDKKNSGVFEESIDIISRIEELESLAVLKLVRETVKPKINQNSSNLKLSMKKVYHPLLDPDTVVSNDASLNGKLTVITGSNMSGKTTFMRTVAINMVLGFIGAGVCAESFEVPYVKLFTSMRVMDDVSGGISTFYAEILRIKEMAEYVASDPEIPALCLIDEIFKGTNSADRIVGSEKALRKLAAGNSMVIVTTHDFELCDLTTEDGKVVDNYHFEEQYENGALKFDYTMRDGRCTTRNAMAILKMAGLVQS